MCCVKSEQQCCLILSGATTAVQKCVLLSLLRRAQSLRLYEGHPVRPHVRVQIPFRFEHLPAHFAFGVRRPVGEVQLVLSLALVVAAAASSVAPRQALRLLQPVDDEEVSGQRRVGGVAEAALPTLEGRAVELVLREVLVEGGDVLGGETADGALVNFEDVHLELLQRLRVGAPGAQAGRPLIVLLLPLLAEGLWRGWRGCIRAL